MDNFSTGGLRLYLLRPTAFMLEEQHLQCHWFIARLAGFQRSVMGPWHIEKAGFVLKSRAHVLLLDAA